MLYESFLFGSLILMSSSLLTGCSKKKAAPSVPKSPMAVNTPVAAASKSNTKSPVSKSPGKETDGEGGTKGETGETGGNGTTGGTGTTGEAKDSEMKKDDNETKDDKKSKVEDKDDEKKDEDGEKKKDSDEKDDDKKEEVDKKTKKKETLISVDPTELRFETAITSQKKLRLKNLTTKKLMFKIKATTTNVYLINPVFGKIEPNNFADVMITHRPSAKREDKLVIVTTEMVGKEIEMAKTFKAIKTTGADVSVKLVAE